MAEPQEPFPGADRIRSLTDQDSIFRAFDSYPWTKDAAFLSGLRAILGPPNAQKGGASLRDMATHARIFYYAQRIGVHVDFAAYHAWLARHPRHATPNIVPPEYEQEPSAAAASPALTSTSSSSPPEAAAHSTTSPTAASSSSAAAAEATPWQHAAPKADLYIQRKTNYPSSASHSHSHSSSEPEPAYPIAFAEMIKLLQEGKPIPGIRQIPNTIERDPTVKPVGSRPVPRKPWEREASATPEANSGFVESTLDLEFPPVEQQAAAAATQS